ncbi:MAG: ribosome biogenesis GTPase Der [Verrucomicrobia bacterium]|nr:ribosome biogenesis GTPase Der [Verrucomicrobiota bacterium]MBV9658646.1 ribosome biogenesis GTPase Der [Verrucomicrobiota bacterium]
MEAPALPVAARVAAIVGRPNVGKSALFNRLAGRQIAIVHDQPGITRDRLSAECRLGSGAPFEIFDTGGIGADVDGGFTARVRAEAEIAIAAAAVILFVVDGRAGLTPVDLDLAARLRRAGGKPVLLVINKIDQPELDAHAALTADFARLGFAETYAVSAAHGRGINPLVAAIERWLPPVVAPSPDAASSSSEEISQSTVPRLALIGRPNVGKSSLTNALLGAQRTIVSEVAGTTRDAVDIPCVLDGQPYVLIDTAGLRHRGKRDNSAEIFSAMRSEKSVRRADLCVLVIDASAGVTSQDRQIAGLVQKANKPCLVAVNKWDLLAPPMVEGNARRVGKKEAGRELHAFRQEWLERARAELFFLPHVPFIALSALRGDDLPRLTSALADVRAAAQRKLATGPLNRALRAALELQPPPLVANRRFKLLYATQIEHERRNAAPVPVPAFLLFVNDPALLTDGYRRYLETKLRELEPYRGLPILFKLRGREETSAD